MVGLGYLFLTIIIELPIVYAGLKTEITNKKRGIIVICIENTVTTILVFVIEGLPVMGSGNMRISLWWKESINA